MKLILIDISLDEEDSFTMAASNPNMIGLEKFKAKFSSKDSDNSSSFGESDSGSRNSNSESSESSGPEFSKELLFKGNSQIKPFLYIIECLF